MKKTSTFIFFSLLFYSTAYGTENYDSYAFDSTLEVNEATHQPTLGQIISVGLQITRDNICETFKELYDYISEKPEDAFGGYPNRRHWSIKNQKEWEKDKNRSIKKSK